MKLPKTENSSSADNKQKGRFALPAAIVPVERN